MEPRESNIVNHIFNRQIKVGILQDEMRCPSAKWFNPFDNVLWGQIS